MNGVYDDWEHECLESEFGNYLLCYFDLHYTLTHGRPAVMYLPNGDPGYPAEPAECEVWKIVRGTIYDEDMNKVHDEILLEQAQQSFDSYMNKNMDEIILRIFEFQEENEPCEDDYRDDDR